MATRLWIFVWFFISVILAHPLVYAADCPVLCKGCTSARCDLFGCPGDKYCCLMFPTYGWCCTGCGIECPPHCECDEYGACIRCEEGWTSPAVGCTVKAECAAPSGRADCNFYGACLASFNCPFLTGTAAQKCIDFLNAEPSLSKDGQNWSHYVRGCLQTALGSKMAKECGTACSCDALTQAFVNAHVPCYLSGPTNFCKLSLDDLTALFSISIPALRVEWDMVFSSARIGYEAVKCQVQMYSGKLVSKLPPQPSNISALALQLSVASSKAGWESTLVYALYHPPSTTSSSPFLANSTLPRPTTPANSNYDFMSGFRQPTATPINATLENVANWIIHAAEHSNPGVWSILVLEGKEFPLSSHQSP